MAGGHEVRLQRQRERMGLGMCGFLMVRRQPGLILADQLVQQVDRIDQASTASDALSSVSPATANTADMRT